MRRRLAAIVLGVWIAGAVGVAAKPVQRQDLDARLASPGLTDIGEGRRLNFFCLGEGSPTVVFEQGGEGNIANWKAVEPAISAITRACFYDRAGFGYSDPPDRAVTALSVTDDLRALLQSAGVDGPVVLVGHSVGGFYATMYANRFREDIAGLVLVDPGFSGQEAWRTDEDRQREFPHISRGEDALLTCARLARERALTKETLGGQGCFPVSDDLPSGETRYLLHAVTGPHWYEAEHSQSVNFFSRNADLSVSHQQEAAVRRPFGNLPMEVLSASRPPSSAWLSEERERAQNLHWQDGHRQLAERSNLGRWAIVEGAGHFIQKDQPHAVIAAIERVIRQVRSNGRH